jgi:hypothetical protein
LPYTDVTVVAAPGAAPLPLPAGAGSAYVERDTEVPGRIALLIVPASEASPTSAGEEPPLRHTLVVEHADWSIACPLSTGQLHRLTNALDGRGTRSGIRPLATNGELVHLSGAPERLIVEQGEWRVEIPAGPRRALAKALRAAEAAGA